MRKILLSGLLLFATVVVNAQIKYGLKAGVNFANMTAKGSGITVSTESITSFHLTGFAEFEINERFSFQPGLSFQGKGAKIDINESGEYLRMKDDISYLEVPLNGVLYMPLGDGKLFLGAGPYVAFGLFGKSKTETNVISLDSGTEDAKFGNSDEDNVAPIDLGLNFMLGYQLKSGLLFNAGYGLGLANTIPKDLVANGAKSSHKLFSLSIGFAF